APLAAGRPPQEGASPLGHRAEPGAGATAEPAGRPVRVPLDPWSAVAVVVAVAMATFAIQAVGTRGALAPVTLGTAVVAVGAAVVVARRERRPDPPPIVDPVLWRRPAFWTPVTIALLANVGFGALQFLLTLALQDVAGWTPLEAGGAFLL